MTENSQLQELLAQAMPNQAPPPRNLFPFVVSATELMKRDMPPKQMLLSTFMPRSSFGMVVAPRGIGKSWFSLALGVAISTGQGVFLGWKIHQQTRVLYVDGEMQTIDIRDRIKALSGGQELDSLDILPSEELYQEGRPVCLDDRTEQSQIEAMLNALEAEGRRPGLIILDNLSTLRRGVDENSNTETQSLVDFLVKLRHSTYAVLVVHHTNKAGKQRGASIIEVPMDYVIELKKPEGGAIFHQGANFELSFSKIRGRAPENANFVAVLDEDADGKLAFSVDHAAFEVSDDIMVLRVVAESQKIPTQRAIAAKVGCSAGKANKVIQKLAKDGMIEKDARGTRLTDYGRYALHEAFPDRYDPPPNPERFQIPF
ncbi:AAA family ATPase [Yoonia vestfoldensis]|uniref:RecA-family ATPase n=1 Tax=Yoonia vestfoldensis SKA53 TaxID=314232 RepID=A3V8Z1_9RHOB|nr:AAA family ATPase [Yoonia vestfoldensis]EAQ05354.1 RecA-family ATPase [Yoonia vestfoldensis SKA53]